MRVYRLNIEKANNGSSPKSGSDAEASRSTSNGKHERTLSTAASPIDLMREHERLAKYKIEQLALVAGAGAFLALSNAAVHLHDLKTCDLRETLNGSKGATSLDAITFQRQPTETDPSGGSVTRTAVAVKRKVVIWEWRAGELKSEPKEFTFVSGVKSLTWVSEEKIVIGLISNYTILDIDTGALSDIVGPGSIGGAPGQDGGRFGGAGVAGMGYLGMSAPTPLATKIGEDEVMLAKDINTHFIDSDGNSLGRRQIPWSNAPSAIGFSSPYLLTLSPAKGALEVRNPKTLTFLQNIPLSSASRLAIIGVEADWSSETGDVLAFGERTVWHLQPADFGSQVHELVKHTKLDEAVSLLEQVSSSRLHDRTTQMRDVKILKAQALFDQHKFRDSIDLFTDVSAPPQRVIDLFPAFIAGPRVASVDATVDGDDANASPKKSKHSRKPSSINSKSSIHKDTKSHHVDDPEEHVLNGDSKRKSLGQSLRTLQSPFADPFVEGAALKTAVEELRGFLVSTRTKMKKILNPDGTLKSDALESLSSTDIGTLLGKSSFDPSTEQECLLETARLVDTTLFRAYMFVSPSFAGPLFRIDNFCDPNVVNEKLLEADRYNDLIDYFNGKKLHRPALELLKRFGNVDKPDMKAPQLVGPERTVVYLQTLPPENLDLIFEYAAWPLQKTPELAMEIFLADTENAETLPRQRVVDFLEDINLSLAVRYLEHIIHELDDKTPAFHQALSETYVRRLKNNHFSDDIEQRAWSQKTLEFLSDSQNYQAYKILGMLDRDGMSPRCRATQMAMLTCPDPNLFEARAIVLNSMGQYKQALEIYVFNLKDPAKAEE